MVGCGDVEEQGMAALWGMGAAEGLAADAVDLAIHWERVGGCSAWGRR